MRLLQLCCLVWLTLRAFLQSTAFLRFQPTKRPHLSAQKSKPKSLTPRPPAAAPSTPLPDVVPLEQASVTARPPVKTTLADWTAEGEDNDVYDFYGSEKRQRGGRKKRKKNKEEYHVPQNWDDIYDPSRPNNYEDYKHSDEKILEIREWKDKLYAHRLAKRRDSESDSSSNDYRPQLKSMFHSCRVPASAKHCKRNLCLQVCLLRLLHHLMMPVNHNKILNRSKYQTIQRVMMCMLGECVSLNLAVPQNLSALHGLLIKWGGSLFLHRLHPRQIHCRIHHQQRILHRRHQQVSREHLCGTIFRPRHPNYLHQRLSLNMLCGPNQEQKTSRRMLLHVLCDLANKDLRSV